MESLRQRENFYLSQLVDPVQVNRWSQSWRSPNTLELPELEELELDRFIGVLNHSQVLLRDREDVLIWASTPDGKYTPKEGYLKLSAFGFGRGLA